MPEEIKPNQIYTPKEARSFLKVSESTMKRMIKNGIITAFKVSGQYRIWGNEILNLVSPKLESGVFEIISNCETLEILESASPRNPKVITLYKSCKFLIFEVVYFDRQISKSSLKIPSPLSVT